MTAKKSAKRAAVYVRISQDRTGAELGVERQREDCEKLAASLGYTVARTYADNDKSAYSGKPRPSYVRLLDDLRAGRVDAVICWHPDRLHRAPVELEDYITVSEVHSVPTYTVKSGEYDLSTATGRMTARIVGAVARGESEHRADRIARKHEQSAKAGAWRGGTRPFGYAGDGITVLEDEASEVRRMTSAVLAGESLGSLIRDLNDRGISTTTGKTWSYAALRQVLLRPRNAGLSEYRGEIVGAGQWQSLVREDEWRAVCSLLRNPARRRSTTNVTKHLLAGIAVCGVCSERLKSATVRSRNGTSRTVYRCCAYPNADRLDMAVFLHVLSMLDRVKAHKTAGSYTAEDVERTKRATIVRARLDALTTDFADGLIDRPAMRAGTERIRVQLDAIERESLRRNMTRAYDGLAEDGGSTLDWWRALSLARKRACIELLMTVTVTPRGRGRRPHVQIEPKGDLVEVPSDRPGYTKRIAVPTPAQAETLREWERLANA